MTHGRAGEDAPATTIVLEGLHFPTGLRWHEDRLFFSDTYGDAVLAFDPATGAVQDVGEVFAPSGIGWLADGRMLVAAGEDRRILQVGELGNEPYADLVDVASGRLHDLVVHRTGRVVVGSAGPAGLVVVAADGAATPLADGVASPAGMAERSDGALVVADAARRRLVTFAVARDGRLRPEATLALGDVVPGGLCVDREDHVWVTTPFGDEVVRVGPDGGLRRRSIGRPSHSCALGGEDGRTLFVATAPDDEPTARRARAQGRIEALRW